MADFTWDRVEPHTRTDDLEEGLQAWIADSLWLLARQWQLGEFRGEDAATPIHASLEVGWCRLESFRNQAQAVRREDAERGHPPEPIRAGVPLEVRAECGPVRRDAAAIALRVEAGLQFLRRLERAALSGLRADLRRAFPVVIDPDVLAGLPEQEQHRLALMARRAVDGQKLFAASDQQVLRLAPSSAEAALSAVLGKWRQECTGQCAEPGPSGDTWLAEGLEHRFSVAAATPQGEVVLAAPEHLGGQLDWYSFDLSSDPRATHGLSQAPLHRRTLQLLPVPLAYAGMPTARWWEFEEGSIYFGAIEGGPADIGRLCVAEYATVYSDDWFLLPVRLPVGALARVTRLRVIDTFGTAHGILPAAFNDAQRARAQGEGGERAWAFFELSGDLFPQGRPEGPLSAPEEDQHAPWLFLPPVLASSFSGKALEQVAFLRDEGANLAWAVETAIESPTGRPLQRRLLWGLANPPAGEARTREPREEAEASGDAWRYRLQARVPPYWIPLVPEPVREGSSEVRLRRARMLAWDDIPQAWAKGPKGQLLAPDRPLWFFEEEIPRGGVEISRRWQLARGGDGALHLWMARQKRPGRGERGSGLKWDSMRR